MRGTEPRATASTTEESRLAACNLLPTFGWEVAL